MIEGEEEWVEEPAGWAALEEEAYEIDNEDEHSARDLFGEPDPRQAFIFQIDKDDDTSVKIKLKGYTVDSNETAMSTGVTLWPAATALSKYLMKHSKKLVKGQNALELGAGLGLCGIVAHFVGASHVVLTDGDTNALQQLRLNVKSNCDANSVSCRQLRWGTSYAETFQKDYGTFDTILAADVIYVKDSIVPLFETVYTLLKPEGQFLLSWHTRCNGVTIEDVLDAARSKSLVWDSPEQNLFIFHFS